MREVNLAYQEEQERISRRNAAFEQHAVLLRPQKKTEKFGVSEDLFDKKQRRRL
jgi:hypothetical protein